MLFPQTSAVMHVGEKKSYGSAGKFSHELFLGFLEQFSINTLYTKFLAFSNDLPIKAHILQPALLEFIILGIVGSKDHPFIRLFVVRRSGSG
jgi:hypothetical protein